MPGALLISIQLGLWLAAATSIVGAQQGYMVPSAGGGSSLTVVSGTYPAGLGEPLNIVISGQSDAAVLVDSTASGGFRNWALSLQFGAECGTVSIDNSTNIGHQANLGDGRGLQEEIATLRENFGDLSFGTCLETLNGGNHFRYYLQGSTNAYFLEASVEMDLKKQHDIVVDGYNLGRDRLVGLAASNRTIDTTSLTNGSSFSGSSTFNGWVYDNSIVYVAGMLSNSSDGVNHAGTVESNGKPAIDGLTAVITVSVSQWGSTTAGGAGDSLTTPSSTSFSGANTRLGGRPPFLVPAAVFALTVAAAGSLLFR